METAGRRLVISFLALALLCGCAGVEPYEPVNHREDGPESGLFSGPGGEFVIYQSPPEQSQETAAGAASEDENTADEMKKN